MVKPNGRGGWDLSDDDVREIAAASGWTTPGTPGSFAEINAHARASFGRPLYVNRQGEAVDDMIEWAEQMGDGSIARDVVGGYEVSTVFLGIDSNLAYGRPQIFETMTFGSSRDDNKDRLCWRYANEADARAGHAKVVADLTAGRHPRVGF